ncbi:MAG: trypsin-like peptidase domain-containing protein [Candidatus Roizmanbacteria bacterium]|nr:trypsin-like peptidase domain-containing protein [Candidatus Roizmanbacteria bacterium]
MKRLVVLLSFIFLLVVYALNKGFIPASILTNFHIPQISNEQQNVPEGKVIVTSEESAIVKAVDHALPSVVTVAIKKTVTQNIYSIDPFNPFAQPNVQPQQQKVEGNIGSGFVIDKNGVIITNKHVVADTEATYTIITNANKTYVVDKILRDPLNDLAIIKITPKEPLDPLQLADSGALKLGQLAIAIGTPLGEFKNTVTSGIVSGLGRGITAGSAYEGYVERLDNVIQTDAAISPGNSGGPLLNSSGLVIGINTAVSQQGQNIGFAIPSNVIRELLSNYIASGGTISRPYLGVQYSIIDRDTALLNKVPAGALVRDIVKGSGADDAHIIVGDIITEIDGIAVTKEDDIAKMVASHKVGDTLTLSVFRDKKVQKIQIKLKKATG